MICRPPANLNLAAPCPARKPSGSCAARRLRPIARESDSYGELVAAAHTGSTSPDVAEPVCQPPPQIKALWHWPPTERLRRLLCIHPPRGGNSTLVCRLTSLSNDNVDPAPIDGWFRSRWRDVSVGGTRSTTPGVHVYGRWPSSDTALALQWAYYCVRSPSTSGGGGFGSSRPVGCGVNPTP